MVEVATAQFAAAQVRGEAHMGGPRAESANYDAGRNRIIIRLTTGLELGLAPRDVEGLQHASTDDLKVIGVKVLGFDIHFPAVDADLYVPALLEGVLGSKAGWLLSLAHLAVAHGLPKKPRRHVQTANVVAARAELLSLTRDKLAKPVAPKRTFRSRHV